jgi:hypothetical protein
VVGQVFITFETVRERGGRPGLLTFLAREEVNASLENCLAFEAVVSIFVDPL